MNRLYKDLDSKVDQLFDSSEEEASQQEARPTDAELDEAETCIQDTIARLQDPAPVSPLTDDPAAATPDEAATTESVPDTSSPAGKYDPATAESALEHTTDPGTPPDSPPDAA